jgi:DNA-binding response OmpR family regulator
VPHILVLEHYQPTQQALGLALRRAGWEVAQVATARKALLALARSPYDAVLVDLDMPTGDGWQVLEALHATHTPPAIVALLGSESSGRRRAQTLGVSIILPKPVGKEPLLAGLRAALNQSA